MTVIMYVIVCVCLCIQRRRLHIARVPSTFTNGWPWGHRENQNDKQKTDQTALTITKALTKTANCTCRAKNGGARQKKFFRRFVPDVCPPPNFQIRSVFTFATVCIIV